MDGYVSFIEVKNKTLESEEWIQKCQNVKLKIALICAKKIVRNKRWTIVFILIKNGQDV